MKHHVFGRKLGRDIKERTALFRSLSQSLIEYGSITTTLAKAKAVRGQVEKLVTKARKKTTASTREISSVLKNPRLEKKLIEEIAPMFQTPGGYVRIYRVGVRAGDKAQQAVIQWVKREEKAVVPELVAGPSSEVVMEKEMSIEAEEENKPKKRVTRKKKTV